MFRFFLTLSALLTLQGVASAQNPLPPDVRARNELSQTVAELVRVRGAWKREGGRTVQEMSSSWEEYSVATDKVGNFVLGYIVALLDQGVQVLGTKPCTVNAFTLAEEVIERMVIAEDRWRDKWVEVLRDWFKNGLLAESAFRSRICSSN